MPENDDDFFKATEKALARITKALPVASVKYKYLVNSARSAMRAALRHLEGLADKLEQKIEE